VVGQVAERGTRRLDRSESSTKLCAARQFLVKRDKLNLDIFWLKDASLEDPDTLPPPDEIAAEIIENLEAALQ
jgi:type I restriction enzyme M protein